jgi:hypothetical protein
MRQARAEALSIRRTQRCKFAQTVRRSDLHGQWRRDLAAAATAALVLEFGCGGCRGCRGRLLDSSRAVAHPPLTVAGFDGAVARDDGVSEVAAFGCAVLGHVRLGEHPRVTEDMNHDKLESRWRNAAASLALLWCIRRCSARGKRVRNHWTA